MKKRIIILGLVFSVFLIMQASAGVYFSQPESNYNLGDIINITLDIDPLDEGPIRIDLVCEDSFLVSYNSAPTNTFNFKLPLSFANIPDLKGGECHFLAEYSGEAYTSRTFTISKKLIVKLSKDSIFSKPGEEIIISGSVGRLSGLEEGINGEIEINIPLLELADQELVEGLEEEGWKEEAITLATEKLEEDDYLEVYYAIDDFYNDINEEEDIEYVRIKEEEVSSVDAENKDAIVSQKIKVKYEAEPEEETNDAETIEKIVYLKVTTTINDADIDSQNFQESDEEEDEEENIDFDNGVFFGKIVDGQFSVSFSLAEDTPSGDYRIDVLAYEVDYSGEKTSEGLAMANLKISQILTEIDIALGDIDLNPGEQFSFKPSLIDQAGFLITDDVSIIIRDEELVRIFEKIIPSGETINYDIPTNLTSSYYEIEASSEELIETKKFYVNEKAIISFEINNQTLRVTNIGNIPYKKNIQINLGDKSFVKSLNLDLGESQEFELEGYDGEYNVWVSDGENELSQSSISLTGNAVNVKAIGNSLLTTPITWIFLLIVLGAGVLFLFRNVLKKKSFAFPFKNLFHRKSKTLKLDKDGKIMKEHRKEKIEKKEIEKKEPEKSSRHEAEQVLVLKGQKNRATVVALHIKNKISKAAKKGLGDAIDHVYEKRGAVYERDDYIFVVFSPLMTRSFKNEIKAAKAAEKIASALKEHNKKFTDKIEFGIGMNSGNIISKVENKKLKFTALGNLIGPAKRLAQASKGQILITKEAYERGISDIKAQKKKFRGTDVYEVRRIMDQEKNQKFIQGFLKRMGNEGK